MQGGSYYGVCGRNPLGRDCSNEIDLKVLFYPYVQFIMSNMVALPNCMYNKAPELGSIVV